MLNVQDIKSSGENIPVKSMSTKPSHSDYALKSYDEQMRFCEIVSKSSLCPKTYQGSPYDVFIACQMGSDLGLKPLQALQNIAVINGRPCLWGDGALAVVMSHPHFLDSNEHFEGDIAVCVISRKNKSPIERRFSIDDAKKAGLWSKQGPWSSYPTRMLQMRARGFAMRDCFPDALRGIGIVEEVQDYELNQVTKVYEPVVNKPILKHEVEAHKINEDFKTLKEIIGSCENIDDLGAIVPELQHFKGTNTDLSTLRCMYKEKLKELKAREEKVGKQEEENATTL